MIPRAFFWVFDLAAFSLAFLFAYVLLPVTQTLAMYLIKVLAPSQVSNLPPWLGILPSIAELGCILVIVSIAGVLALDGMRTHRNLLEQSITRIVVTSVIAPMVGLS